MIGLLFFALVGILFFGSLILELPSPADALPRPAVAEQSHPRPWLDIGR